MEPDINIIEETVGSCPSTVSAVGELEEDQRPSNVTGRTTDDDAEAEATSSNANNAIRREKRTNRKKFFERRVKTRNKLNKDKIIALDKNLKDWFKRTRMPTVALSFCTTMDGRPKEFEDFGKDREIAAKFQDIVMKNMTNVFTESSDKASNESREGELDEMMGLALSRNVLDFSLSDKRKFVTQIISLRSTKRDSWHPSNMPAWWPVNEAPFKSPNERKPGSDTMSRVELDIVLNAFTEYASVISGLQSEHLEMEITEEDNNFN
eukprot:gene7588-8428_t